MHREKGNVSVLPGMQSVIQVQVHICLTVMQRKKANICHVCNADYCKSHGTAKHPLLSDDDASSVGKSKKLLHFLLAESRTSVCMSIIEVSFFFK